MRGGKSVAERGVIPRLLSSIYKRGRELEKKSEGQITVTVDMTYYEIYNDKVFDLFEPLEKRSLAGLPLREHDKKTIVVGLTEKRVSSLKEFEALYDTANANRTTFATKLNASSSRSHAITGVRVTVENTTIGEARVGTLSAIDLAGSEDNRRACNDKERITESASINKSLFVLAQCVEAISKKQARIPYRESKMTRILSLGQNNGMTVMILNIAPTRAYHLDTLSSLNFANRAKKIEVKQVENSVMKMKVNKPDPNASEAMQRPALRPISNSYHGKKKPPISEKPSKTLKPSSEKPPKPPKPTNLKERNSNAALRPQAGTLGIKPEELDKLVEQKVEEILASRALNDKSIQSLVDNDAMIKRVEHLEQQLNEKLESTTAATKPRKAQAADSPELSGFLKMYEVDLDDVHTGDIKKTNKEPTLSRDNDDPFILTHTQDADHSLASVRTTLSTSIKPAGHKRKKAFMVFQEDDADSTSSTNTPRTTRLLAIINSEDVGQIKCLRGVGPKRAQYLASYVKRCKVTSEDGVTGLNSLQDLAKLPGIGTKIVEAMRVGVGEAAALPIPPVKRLCKDGDLKGRVQLNDEDYVPTPVRRRSKTVMTKREAVQEAVREYVDHFDAAWA